MKNNFKMKGSLKSFLVFVVIILSIGALFSFYDVQKIKNENISLIELSNSIKSGEIEKIVIEGDRLSVESRDGSIKKGQKEKDESLTQTLINLGVSSESLSTTNIEIKDESGLGFWAITLLPFLVPFAFIGFFIWFMFRKVQGANSKALSFGESGAKEADKKKKTTFNDVAGAKEAKEELDEIVDFLKDPQKFIKLGAEIPKGVLLLGSPGTGKTLLARAVAGEADVPFFHISGSEFVEMFVGVGASRVRDLFKKAKKQSPCIVFIDEIDAVGRQRGAGLGGSHDEREQTLNQILVEMDGFDNKTNVIVVAATNRPDVLDPALLRPGRFDRQIVIDLPDIKDREAILKLHVQNKPLKKDVDLKIVAQRTPGFSGADLRNVLNEAAIFSARKNENRISQQDILGSIEKVILGPERKSHIMSEEEKKITAYHEAGHALVGHFLPNCDPIHKISIISRGRAAGYTMNLPETDKHLHTKSKFSDDISMMLGGLVAEQIVFKENSNGASSDLKQVSNLAKQIITKFGMNENLGYRAFGQGEGMVFLGKEIHDHQDYSEKTAENIDAEIKKLVDSCYQKAKDVIIENRDILDKVSNVLLKKETIERREFEELVGKK
jgi:cell division protease FtsH